MLYTMEDLSDRMRQDTERFLSRAIRTMRQPRAEYERLLRELRDTHDDERPAPQQTRPVPQRPAA